MPKLLKYVISILLFLIIFSSSYEGVDAASCVANISPNQVTLGTSSLTFTINNEGPENATSIKIININSTVFEINSGSLAGWNSQVGESDLVFSGNTFLSNSTLNVEFVVNALIEDISTFDVEIYIDGIGFVGCSGSGEVTVSGEATVVTPAPIVTTVTNTVTNTITNTVTSTVTNVVTKVLTDETSPIIRFLGEFKKTYEEAPLVGIKITDSYGIARLEYSLDSQNYLPINIGDSIGNKTITTDFIPKTDEDGDYNLVVRAVDSSGNIGLSNKINFTIDRLPPRVGPLVVMAGPLLINSGSDGLLELSQGVEYKFILSAAGGPNKIVLSCQNNVYEFNKNFNIGLWTTKVKFDESLNCTPEITATDGAGNTQTIKTKELRVDNLGKLENGLLTVYWYDDYEKKFVVWDALPYGQTNPIDTRGSAGYSLLLPSGKYYLEAKANGKRTSVSNIIDINSAALINDDWELSPSWKFWQIREEKNITPKILGSSDFENVNFALPKVSLNGLTTLDIRGKNSAVFLFSSWHPEANNILKVIDELNKNKYSVYPILLHEKDTIAKSVKKRGMFDLNIYTDNDGEITKNIEVFGLPTVWIVDRFGQVVKTKIGSVDYKEIVNVLLNNN